MKKFENFINDDNRDNTSLDLLPKYNPVVNLEYGKYIDKLLDKNREELTSLAGIKRTKKGNYKFLDEEYETHTEMFSDEKRVEEIKKIALDYCINNQVKMKSDTELDLAIPLKSGDGIPRVDKVGGTSHANSPRIGESKSHFDKEIKISSDEMSFFDNEQPLIDLISDRKIQILNNIIKYNNRDKETKQILDVYFELDEVDPIEETLAYLTHSDTKPSSIVYLGELGVQFDLSNFTNIETLIEIKNKYSDAFLFDSIDEKTEQNLVKKAKSVFQGWDVRTMRNIGEVSEQSSEFLGIPNGRFEILTVELVNNDYKLSMDVTKSVSNFIPVFISKVSNIKKEHFESKKLITNSTYICDIQHDYEGWKELLSNIFEKL